MNTPSSSKRPSLILPARKAIRADIIREHMIAAGYKSAVCFSCGNASRALIDTGVTTLDISPSGSLEPRCWWTPSAIHSVWPNRFDATSGHLPVFLMAELAAALARDIGDLGPGPYDVPTGSGETILALRLAYQGTMFVAAYDDTNPATQYNVGGPLNALVARGSFTMRVTPQ